MGQTTFNVTVFVTWAPPSAMIVNTDVNVPGEVVGIEILLQFWLVSVEQLDYVTPVPDA
jgi:hypothetical protein